MVSFTHNWLNYFVYKRLEYFYHSDSIKLLLGDLNIWSPIYRHPISFTLKVGVILLFLVGENEVLGEVSH